MAFRVLVLALAVVIIDAPRSASAQEANRVAMHACYMPSTGLLYLIGLAGLPAECRSPNHVALRLAVMPPTPVEEVPVEGTGRSVALLAEPGEPPTGQDHLPPGSISTSDLANSAVTSLKILNGTIAAADLAVGSVTSSRIRNGAVAVADIADGAVTSNKIADGTIQGRDLAERAIGSSRIRWGTVNENHLADGAVTAAKLAHPGWALAGNAGTKGTDFIGTTDGQPLRVRVDDEEVLTIVPDGGAVFGGTAGIGAIPVEGGGTRLMWYPKKAAFRAGEATGAEWDDDNIGWHSTAAGENTIASGDFSTAMGTYATASDDGATALGSETTASGLNSTALGDNTTASGESSTAMGIQTTASGTASTAMGTFTTASGERSTALGSFASTSGQRGAFVFGDTSTPALLEASAENQFSVRAAGGVRLFTNSGLTAGVTLGAGAGAWATVSDRNRKEAFRDVDGEDALAKIAQMPIQSWSYLSEDPSIRHLGPVAQDFYEAFGLGEDHTTITTTDIDGVNMLAIQALERRNADLRAENEELRAESEALKAQLAEVAVLRERLAAVEASLETMRR